MMAGTQITKVYSRHNVSVDVKGDDRPVTIADRRADTGIEKVLTLSFLIYLLFKGTSFWSPDVYV